MSNYSSVPSALKIRGGRRRQLAALRANREARRTWLAERYAEAAAAGPIPHGQQQRWAEQLGISKAQCSRELAVVKAEARALIAQDAQAAGAG